MNPNVHALAEAIVEEHLGQRLDQGSRVPGLREAVIDLVADAFSSEAEQLMHAQLRLLNRPGSTDFPDAYLADESAAEDALQRAAAGLRVALAQSGRLVEARRFERALADRLRDDPRLALRAERARVPRPLTRPVPLRWSVDPAPWYRDSGIEEGPWPPSGANAIAGLRRLPGGASALARVTDGPYTGWTQVAMMERHRTPARSHPPCPARQVLVAVGLEVGPDDPSLRSLPFARSRHQVWTVPWQQLDPTASPAAVADGLSTGNWPLTALTNAGHTDPYHPRTGLGSPPYGLAPVLAAVVALRLQPTKGLCGFSLSDESGPAAIGRHWRGHLVHDGNYQPLKPAVEGTDLLVRPDLFSRLCGAVGSARLHTGISVSFQAEAGDDDE
ncbi:hypothetical protein AB0O82_35145 [Kitasatospora sp. NPDC088264]|uniref:hypothetical protein n=1 Tax=Kitasatospora sp. NPDC088264 TaxID=3155296 RepID=UPI0034470A4F